MSRRQAGWRLIALVVTGALLGALDGHAATRGAQGGRSGPPSDPWVTVAGRVTHFDSRTVFLQTVHGLLEVPRNAFGDMELKSGGRAVAHLRRSGLNQAATTVAVQRIQARNGNRSPASAGQKGSTRKNPRGNQR